MSKENITYIDFAIGEIVDNEAAMRISEEQEAARRQREQLVSSGEPLGIDLDLFAIHLDELRHFSNKACEHGGLHEHMQARMHKVMKGFSLLQRELAWNVVQRNMGQRTSQVVKEAP